jgi:ferredoxin-NADP reductase
MITLGTGIAPFMQFLDQAKNSKNEWNIILLYTNRYQNEVYFRSLLEELTACNKLKPFLSFTAEGGKRISRFVEDNCEAIRDMIEKVGL